MAVIAEELTNNRITEIEEELRWMADTYEQIQRVRIGIGNRVWASTADRDSNMPHPFLQSLHEKLFKIETDLGKEMKDILEDHLAWPWLSRVKGIGPTLATKILGLIGDISRYDTVSKLWRYAGYGVIDGKAERNVKGEKSHFNRRLKTALYLVGDSFIKSRSPYRQFYDKAKERYAGREGWTPLHISLAARRKMIKIFLAHLWETWREAQGLPIRKPYVIDYLEHTTYVNPWEMVKE